ncbi:hypothetical protein VP01_3592g1, partial [Puccinia sorghi]
EGESVYYYFFPPNKQHEPFPNKILTMIKALRLYHHLSHGTFPSFQLHFTHRTSRLGMISLLLLGTDPVFQTGEEQWTPQGWRDVGQRYCLVACLSAPIQLCKYSPNDKAAYFREPTIGLQLTLTNWLLEFWNNTINFSSNVSCPPFSKSSILHPTTPWTLLLSSPSPCIIFTMKTMWKQMPTPGLLSAGSQYSILPCQLKLIPSWMMMAFT